MIRSLAVLAFVAAGLATASAQEIAPAAPSAADIVIDPAASLDKSPKQASMLTGLYATRAVIELCNVTVDPKVLSGLAADQTRLETSLGMDTPTGTTAYAGVKADVEKTSPDCADGSADRASVDAVVAIYAGQSTAPAAGTAAPTAGTVSTAPAAPAAPAP